MPPIGIEEAARVEAAHASLEQNVGAPWMDRASDYFVDCIKRHNRPMLAEEVKHFWELDGGDLPHEPRAWGAVVARLSKAGKIVFMGRERTLTSNGSLRPVWYVL